MTPEEIKYNPTCIITGKKNNLVMFPHRNDNGDMVGWVFVSEDKIAELKQRWGTNFIDKITIDIKS